MTVFAPNNPRNDKGYLYLFGRMDFQQMSKKTMKKDLSVATNSSCAGAQARRYWSGVIRFPTENLSSRTLLRCEKPPKTNE